MGVIFPTGVKQNFDSISGGYSTLDQGFGLVFCLGVFVPLFGFLCCQCHYLAFVNIILVLIIIWTAIWATTYASNNIVGSIYQ